ncbi:TetR/AcrR family transcriptional regulator [Paraburkholderia dioscoreae]|uniref:Transcriptional regulator, TetR family n=1 Tax=Paraburkholderia dioscoreae TaxID=2604047 RepID=A0A5Q4YWK7_9BURK|nr:TetR family transcriptional regulator [Paraburkholderia dioscoreae]VVD33747.1 Transcriptional regulator, TetR family [Paraburkholderia dioscoreae]
MKDISLSSADLGGQDGRSPLRQRGNRTTRIPEIIEASIRVFASEGNIGFTQRRVAAEAQIRLGTLQHYFGSRDTLLLATIEEVARRYLEQYRSLSANTALSPWARLEAILDDVFDALTASDNVVSPFAFECWCLAEHQPAVRELMVKVSKEFQALFSGLVSQINIALPAEECRLRGALLYSHWEGLIVFLRRSGSTGFDAAAFRTATKVVWKAMSVAPQ